MKPVLFVTGHAPPDRSLPSRACTSARASSTPCSGAGWRTAPARRARRQAACPFPIGTCASADLALAASGRYRAVVVGTGGRVALPAAWAGARRAACRCCCGASLWAHPRSLAHAGELRRAARACTARADAVVTYGPHVSAYVRARARATSTSRPRRSTTRSGARAPRAARRGAARGRRRGDEVSVCRSAGAGKGPSGAAPGLACLRPRGTGRRARPRRRGIYPPLGPRRRRGGPLGPTGLRRAAAQPSVPARGAGRAGRLRNFYAAADVLVMPSVRTPTFREPWGLVANEAMNQRPARNRQRRRGRRRRGPRPRRAQRAGRARRPAGALAEAMRRLAGDPALRARLGARRAQDVRAYTHQPGPTAWGDALRSVGCSREH